ncbi:hypothetical protein DID97_17410 [Burkholderia sp. Bp8977]|nr:hypothetical protein DID97_17410 [Burkholderia sp. Bp8977]
MRLSTLIREIRTGLAHQVIHRAVGMAPATHVSRADELAQQPMHDITAACEARFLGLRDECWHRHLPVVDLAEQKNQQPARSPTKALVFADALVEDVVFRFGTRSADDHCEPS